MKELLPFLAEAIPLLLAGMFLGVAVTLVCMRRGVPRAECRGYKAGFAQGHLQARTERVVQCPACSLPMPGDDKFASIASLLVHLKERQDDPRHREELEVLLRMMKEVPYNPRPKAGK